MRNFKDPRGALYLGGGGLYFFGGGLLFGGRVNFFPFGLCVAAQPQQFSEWGGGVS